MGHILNLSNFTKAFRYLKKNGLGAAFSAVEERILQERSLAEEAGGNGTGSRYQPPSETELDAQRRRSWPEPVLFSIAVPAYETDPVYLKELLDSLQEQTYPCWELILADAGTGDSVRKAAEARADERIRYIRLASNDGIAGNTNAAIELAQGAYIGLLDHDDILTRDALYEMACALEKQEQNGIHPVFLYSDEDKCDGEAQNTYEPHRKTDFNLDLLLSNNYICHFLVMDAAVMKRLRLRTGFDGAQDWCFARRDRFLKERPRKPMSISQRSSTTGAATVIPRPPILPARPMPMKRGGEPLRILAGNTAGKCRRKIPGTWAFTAWSLCRMRSASAVIWAL